MTQLIQDIARGFYRVKPRPADYCSDLHGQRAYLAALSAWNRVQMSTATVILNLDSTANCAEFMSVCESGTW